MQISVDGLRVVEAESFTEGDIEAARAVGAQLLWVHSNDDLSAYGFRRTGAYLRMHADAVPVRGREPSFLEERDYAEVLARAYSGLWGHKHVSPLAQPREDAVVVGLPVVGLCTVFPAERLIDSDLDSWGDAEETIEAYEDLGFDVVERVQGWELQP